MSTTQYTIRGITSELDAKLRRKARLKGLSLNQVVIDQLSMANSKNTVAHTKKQRDVNTDFDDLFGTMTPIEPEVIEALKAQRVIFPEDWK
ncbi:MAG TPA: hypothetical protein VGF75_07670 [Candidatus Saccharimonadales bacterium]|jgi:hypothetical protein